MDTVQLSNQLPLLVRIEAKERIQKITLTPHSAGFAYTISGHPSRTLQTEIHQFLEHYISKKEYRLPALEEPLFPSFTQNVLRYLPQIPFGTTVTYGHIAKALSAPQAARAVGSACGRNPFPLFVPCHRVVSTVGLGGFNCGLDIKNVLLEFENKFDN